MNIKDPDGADVGGLGDEEREERKLPKALPDDLPTSLNDRRAVPDFTPETEMYDAWQGASPWPRRR
jgi:hypothetical protein